MTLLIRCTEYYVENKILIKAGKPRTVPGVGLINCGVRQVCPLSPSLFNLYIDDVIQNWQMCLPEHFMICHSTIDTLLFADNQVILSDSKNRLQICYAFVKSNLHSA